ncbi:MAG: hypothetical protein JO170_24460 [Verrucomicrobia bacterium]|nr:hypothetical protein [Verrucomicrobiota bacterium]HTD57080.1 hypothetical protein [Silvibacterium sp.]
MPNQTQTTLLDYGIDMSPRPLQVSADSGSTCYAVIRFVVSNSNSNPVLLSQLQFVMPVGVLAQNLTADAAAVLFRSEPVGQWQMAMTPYGVFTAIPSLGKPLSVASNGLYFQLDNVPVNVHFGSVQITINEKASSANAPAQLRSARFHISPRA